MPAWLSDPIVRFSLRHSVAWMRLVPIIPVILVEASRRADGRLARLGLFALCCAAPQAAAHLLEMEHDGRLDQMRLAGRRPVTIATISLAAMAGPWLLAGIVLIGWSMLSGAATWRTLLAVLALAGSATMLAAFSTTVTFARERIDPRIGVVGLGAVTIVIAIGGAEALKSADRWTLLFALALIVETIVIGLCMRNLPHRIAHAPIHTAGASRLQVPFRQWLLRWPGVYRGSSLSSSGLVLFALFAPMAALVRIIAPEGSRQFETAGLFVPPLAIGLIAISLICREDAVSGRLDMVRQSATRIAVTAFQMLLGLWLPFVLAAVGVVLVAQVFVGVSLRSIQFALLFLIFLAPIPLVEGWSRLWPLMLLGPFAVAAGALILVGAWPGVVALSALFWVAAGRILYHPDKATLRGWHGVAATSALCLAPFVQVQVQMREEGLIAFAIATTLLAASPILIRPGSGRRLDRWGQPIAMFVTVWLGASWHLAESSFVAVSVAAVWYAAYRIRQWDPSRPTAQAITRIVVLLVMGQFLDTPPSMVTNGQFAVAAVAIAVGVEVGFRIATMIARRRKLIFTLPA
ncbi:MAG: hypothetical protein Q7R30_22270 [Acidobacteriota bacterium]|nr:hypothetical protein [Acidobacteriota bacterium]